MKVGIFYRKVFNFYEKFYVFYGKVCTFFGKLFNLMENFVHLIRNFVYFYGRIYIFCKKVCTLCTKVWTFYRKVCTFCWYCIFSALDLHVGLWKFYNNKKSSFFIGGPWEHPNYCGLTQSNVKVLKVLFQVKVTKMPSVNLS